VLIEEDAEHGFIVKDAEVRTYPAATDDHPAGFSMLTSLPLPDTMIEPDAFILGSRAILDAVVAKVRSFFRTQPDVILEWLEFAASAPVGDCVQEYCSGYPLDIPFKVRVVSIFFYYLH
jgi:hypothetical protein